MDTIDNEPVTLTAQPVLGPTYGLGTLVSVAVLASMIGAVCAGIIVPAAVTAMPDFKAQEESQASIVRDNALLVSLGALTLWAAPGDGAAPVATDTDLNGYLQDIEVRAAQLGLMARRDLERTETSLTVSFGFEERPSATGIEPPASKASKDHPRALQLVFEAGAAPGSLLLTQARADGRVRTPGQIFVDLVSLGGLKPELQPGQVLTRRGVAEIRTGVNGNQALFLDGSAIYPATVAGPGEPPVTLKLDAALPEGGLFADHLMVVRQGPQAAPCHDRLLVVDVVDLKLQTLDRPLAGPGTNLQAARGAVTFGPFCQPGAQNPATLAAEGAATALQPVVMRADGSQVVLNARLDLATDRITWAPSLIPAPVQPVAATTPQGGVQPAAAAPTDAVATAPWRATGPDRIASPIVPGGILVSVTCSAEGYSAIAVSGLPAPAEGDAGRVRFASGGTAAAAAMRWLPEARVYELSARTRPAEAAALLARLSASGALTVTTAGVSKATSAPGQARIAGLTARCKPRTDTSRAETASTTG
ncbi:MAG: hypothetical protein MUF14_05395 [Hyphomonadaceae bacterium]|nr:hypothetical protein [Hyphomonadaceae bacterium]